MRLKWADAMLSKSQEGRELVIDLNIFHKKYLKEAV